VNSRLLLRFLKEAANIDRKHIGDIDVLDKFTFIDLRDTKVKSLIKGCSIKRLNGKKVRVEVSTPR
jgi:ATP-dependent RNA helicase DeaD